MRDYVVIACCFVLVRAVTWWMGVAFDYENLGTWWQIADVELLRTRLCSTLFYLHSQPPLFNLLIGLALRAGDAFAAVMEIVYGVVCLGGILCLHSLGRVLLGSRWLSLLIALWFCVSPDVLLFNEKLFYDGLVPWLLCMGLWGLHGGLSGRWAPMLFGFSMLATVVLLRSMFHPLWFVAVVGLAFVTSGFQARVLVSAALPTAAIGAVLIKNLVVFGFLGLSSWAPLNLVGVTVEKLPDQERQELVATGRLSALSSIAAFGPIEQLLPLLPAVRPDLPRDPVLDDVRKANGRPNMNHWAMLEASRRRTPDVLASVQADPTMYGVVLLTSLNYFHRPASDFRDVRRNLALIEPWTRLINATVGLQPAAWFGSALAGGRPLALWMQVSFGSLLVSAGFMGACGPLLGHLLAAAKRRRAPTPEQTVLLLVLVTGVFVFLVSTAFDVLENNRARYTVAPLLTLAAASALQRSGVRRVGARLVGARLMAVIGDAAAGWQRRLGLAGLR